MKSKLILPILFLFSFTRLFSQLDLEHWFPPVFLQNLTYTNSIDLHLTTPHTDAFEVKIFDGNNTEIASLQLDKDNPVVYKVPNSAMLASKYSGMRVLKKGLHIAGGNSFYANIRFNFDYGYNTEIISSKGKSALGSNFNSINAPYQQYSNNVKVNHQTSFIATKDNTTVRISGFSEKITFSDQKKYEGEIIVKLNKGESYCLASAKNDNPGALPFENYWDTFVGAKIESDQPIAVINGNFQGLYNFEEGGKLLIDQSLPVNKIGNSYYIKKGFTDLEWEIEGGLVVATQDNTQIYLNGNPNPSFALNEGEFRILRSTEFLSDGIYVNSQKPFYFYQLSGGNNAQDKTVNYAFRTPAFALVPPLDSNLPHTIGFISDVEKIGTKNFDNYVHLIAEKGASVTVNGNSLNGTDGPFSIPGNPEWEFFKTKNISGSLEVAADKAIILGVLGGNESSFSSGSFAYFYTGFSNDPKINSWGNCIEEGMVLSLSNKDFESFQWLKDGTAISGATSSSYTPTLPGTYSCIVYYSGFQYTTPEISVMNCSVSTFMEDLGESCSTISKELHFKNPAVTSPISLIEVTSPAEHSELQINTPDITITPIQNYSGDDKMILKLSAANGYSETHVLHFRFLAQPIADLKNSINSTLVDGQHFYDLTTSINNYNEENFTFYESLDNLQQNVQISHISNYSTNLEKIYVKTTNIAGCQKISELLLVKSELQRDLILNDVITPNGDDFNDRLSFAPVKKIATDYTVKIFDRYQRVIFDNNLTKADYWDGTDFTRQKVATGVYWIEIKYIQEGKEKLHHQWILVKSR